MSIYLNIFRRLTCKIESVQQINRLFAYMLKPSYMVVFKFYQVFFIEPRILNPIFQYKFIFLSSQDGFISFRQYTKQR